MIGVRAMDGNELAFRRRALRDATICIGCIKLVSVICYTGLFFLVYLNTKGQMSKVLQIMCLVAIFLQVILGIFLFIGALECKPCFLSLGMWLGLIIASYNTVMGVIGSLYYIRSGKYTAHFLLACMFSMLICSIFVTLCHDMVIIYSFMKSLEAEETSENNTVISAFVVQTTTNIFSNIFSGQSRPNLDSNSHGYNEFPTANIQLLQNVLQDGNANEDCISTSIIPFRTANVQLVQNVVQDEKVDENCINIIPSRTDESCDLLSNKTMGNRRVESEQSKVCITNSSDSLKHPKIDESGTRSMTKLFDDINSDSKSTLQKKP